VLEVDDEIGQRGHSVYLLTSAIKYILYYVIHKSININFIVYLSENVRFIELFVLVGTVDILPSVVYVGVNFMESMSTMTDTVVLKAKSISLLSGNYEKGNFFYLLL
jgi:hypothetical protein